MGYKVSFYIANYFLVFHCSPSQLGKEDLFVPFEFFLDPVISGTFSIVFFFFFATCRYCKFKKIRKKQGSRQNYCNRLICGNLEQYLTAFNR